ncbi:hypothetical protein DESC_810146 [Desulfosarcina cetonica]|nr:hypothetical protein DESC_810146 [Desulfosarcina cetonica]
MLKCVRKSDAKHDGVVKSQYLRSIPDAERVVCGRAGPDPGRNLCLGFQSLARGALADDLRDSHTQKRRWLLAGRQSDLLRPFQRPGP